MKLEIDVPDVACCRCGVSAGLNPLALKRGHGAGEVTDSAGNTWVASGAIMPAGWTLAPSDTPRHLCPGCTEIVEKGMQSLLQPPPPAPVPANQRQPPIMAAPIRTQPVPIPQHHSPRPAVTTAPPPPAAVRPSYAQPSPIPAAPLVARHQPSLPAVAPPTVRLMTPTHVHKPETVITNSSYPSTEAVKVSGPMLGKVSPDSPQPTLNAEPHKPRTVRENKEDAGVVKPASVRPA